MPGRAARHRSRAPQPEQLRAGSGAWSSSAARFRDTLPSWSSSARGPRAWRRRSMPRPRAYPQRSSRDWRPADRPAPAHRSRTTSDFRPASTGDELAERATIQALKFGAQITIPAEATRLERRDGAFQIELAEGDPVTCQAVVIAAGVRYRRLPIPGLSRFEGTSVHYAATQVEAQMCQGSPRRAGGRWQLGRAGGRDVLAPRAATRR